MLEPGRALRRRASSDRKNAHPRSVDDVFPRLRTESAGPDVRDEAGRIKSRVGTAALGCPVSAARRILVLDWKKRSCTPLTAEGGCLHVVSGFARPGRSRPHGRKKGAPEPGNSCGRRKRITQPRGLGRKSDFRPRTSDPPRFARSEVRGPTPVTADCPEQSRREERYRLPLCHRFIRLACSSRILSKFFC